jgi:two-component system nitrogen regulation response regulator NtrX
MSNDILIVDDESDIRSLLSGILQDEGYDTREASNSEQALTAINLRLPSLVILDIWLQNSALDGSQILTWIQKSYPGCPVIMISGHGNIQTAVAAIKAGAYDFIEKPFKADKLLLLVKRATEAAGLKRENQELRQKVGPRGELIGISPIVIQLRSAIEKVAPTNSRILITGPPGAGKEIVARMLHSKSGRIDAPFLALNCATLNPDRLEIELFGVDSKISQQAGKQIVGVFERAHKGTLFLDEIADMPMETQGKIVRVLQEQKFRRVGGEVEVEVDVRVIASTNRDLEKEIMKKNFREDLFYRLNVVPIKVPPLKQRRDDIPLLTRYFLKQSAEAAGMPLREVTDEAIAILQAYSWPGNVRQLRNVVEWVLIMAPGTVKDVVRADMLPPELGAVAPVNLHVDKGIEIMGMALKEARKHFEREYLVAQVNRFGGNISQTAGFVGMERSALHRKLKSLGVN